MLLARGGQWWRAIRLSEGAVTEVLGMVFYDLLYEASFSAWALDLCAKLLQSYRTL